MKTYIYVFLLFVSSASYAQTVFTPYGTAPIVIDTLSHKSSLPLPFDRNFSLQYTLRPTDSIFTLFTYKVRIDKGRRDLIPAAFTTVISPLGLRLRIPVYTVNPCSWDSLKNVIIINEQALTPNTLIDIAILKKLNKRETDSLMLINQNLYLNTLPAPAPLSAARIQQLYNEFLNNITSTTFPSRVPFNKPTWAVYQGIFNTLLLPRYQAMNTSNYMYTVPGSGLVYDFRTAITYSEIKTFDASIGAAKIADDDLLAFASVIKENMIPQLLDGTADMTSKYPGDIQTRSGDYPKRIGNLTAAVVAMDKVISLLERAQMGNLNIPTNLYERIVYFRALLFTNKNLLKTNYNSVISTIRSNRDFSKEFWLMSQNDFSDLTLLSKNVLVPDLGIATLVLKGHEKYQVYPRPFIGVNIYFRPVDKTLKEKNFPNTDLLRLLSLQVGLTYGKLGGKEFSSLFNDFSLMAGPSVRLARWFRIGAGTVLTQQNDENPIINHTQTNFGYYMALSFDIDILSNATSATGRVFK